MENENIITGENKTKKSRPLTYWGIFVFLLMAVVLVSSTFGAIFGFLAVKNGGIAKWSFGKNIGNTEVQKQKIIEEDSAVISVVEKARPAVVSIVITKDVPKLRQFPDFFNFFDPFGENQSEGSGQTEKQTIGGGSGFLITSDGMIITNKHVVSDSRADYTVITNENEEYPAKVLALDPVNDIAVIKIDGKNYPTVDLGDSGSLKVGQTAIAIGNSLGEFSNTVSKGIISGLKRNLEAGSGFGESEKLSDIIQTDAAINPGNSGGPLLDISGNVIGVNVAIVQGAQNIGFAIPSAQIKRVADQVRTTGKISTPYIGVRYVPIDKNIQKDNNLPFDYGALIARGEKITDLAVIPGSPADKAGLAENDIILEVNGAKISEKEPLTSLISKYNTGDEITLKIWRKGEIKSVKIKLEERK